ncbi:ABC transporter permease subunit [Gordonia sp. JH63]|uniref:ABC transporter permease n=1 Tax=unclassified Gordonia (in: high G+C Gram-positive bacteria) TaxID=2657482 RepID=UPI000990B11E|nr:MULTISPECIES: ABC transporter permease [unclassified Gordonia (in: high G+C Gram-positive bacteria)]MBR7193403.1 ABC transporter permease [Gordonia sp. SCSIO 19800]MCX2753840.1 ABC transporter permease [Gordonia sp. 4N]MDT0220927.1 ABC transporter permease [Gordonia sp. AC31]QHD87342.1 ABC transporter permease subunit [Gordonia sp. JH63]
MSAPDTGTETAPGVRTPKTGKAGTPDPGSTTELAVAARTGRRGRSRSKMVGIAAPLVVLGLVIGAWYLVSYAVLDPGRRFLMPPPHQVVTDGLLGDSAQAMWEALSRTATVALTGLTIAAIIGITWAVIMSQSRLMENALFPYAVVLQCVPILALVPLVGFWFGFGFSARVFVCVLISLFPIVSNTLFGLRSVDRQMRDLFALHRPSRVTILRKLEFPAAMPAIFAGLRISAGLSVVGAIVGDFFFKQGNPGIGILIDNYRSRLQAEELFASIVLASLLGVAVFWFFGWLGNRIVGRWYQR